MKQDAGGNVRIRRTQEEEARWEIFFSRLPFLYTLLAVLVVVLHSDNRFLYASAVGNFGKNLSFALQNCVSGNLCEAAVPSFLLLSGFLFFRDLEWGNIGRKLLRRGRSLLMPYLVWNLIYTLIVLGGTAIPALSGFFVTQNEGIGAAAVLKGIFLHQYNPAAWFLLELILLTLASPLILPVMKNVWAGGALVCAAFAAGLAGVVHLEYFVTEGAFFYLLGAFAAMHAPGALLALKRKPGLTAGILLILLSQALFMINGQCLWDYGGTFFLHRVCVCIGSTALLLVLPFPRQKPWMTVSFFVYMAHGMLVSALRSILWTLLPQTGWVSLGVYLLVPAAVLPLTIAAGLLLKRIVPVVYGLLGGGRA